MADEEFDPPTGFDQEIHGEQPPEPGGDFDTHKDQFEGENFLDNLVVVDAGNLHETVVDSDGEDPVERNEYEIAVVIAEMPEDEQDVGFEVEQIQKAIGSKIDVTFDCAGFNKTMSAALAATRCGGTVCLVGMGHGVMTVPLTPAAAREVDVVGVFRYKNTWPLCLEFITSGKIDVKPLITHRFGFSQKEVEDAFETSARGINAIKVMFNL